VIDPAYRAPSLFPTPERLLLLRDRREKLRFVLVLLAAESDTGLKQALALRLRYIDGRTLESIAAEMGVVEHTVWYWIRDGLQAAARLLHERFRISSGAGL
jgi:DNA-directed RNA polymerase specialized sigma24 family protein